MDENQTNQILDKFNAKATSYIEFPGSIFDGCAATFEGEFQGFKFRSDWVGVNDRKSTIHSPDGELVASRHSMFFDGCWRVKDGAPEWLNPLGDDWRREEGRRARAREEKLEAEEERRAQAREEELEAEES